MQPPQLRTGLGAELFDQNLAQVTEDALSRGLLAVLVQGQHQQRAQPLPQRLGGGQLAQLGDHLAAAAQMHIRIDARLQCLQPQLGQPGNLAQREHV